MDRQFEPTHAYTPCLVHHASLHATHSLHKARPLLAARCPLFQVCTVSARQWPAQWHYSLALRSGTGPDTPNPSAKGAQRQGHRTRQRYRLHCVRAYHLHIKFCSACFSLTLCSLGWDVLATDTRVVLSSVLKHNINTNRPNLPKNSGIIQAQELDWTVEPDNWIWSSTVASHEPHNLVAQSRTLCPPFDLILTADTLYSPDLIAPLLRTLYFLSAPPSRPPIYLILERRDASLADDALQQAREVWSFSVQRVPDKKVAKGMAKAGCKWDRVEWMGVEIWKLLRQDAQVKD